MRESCSLQAQSLLWPAELLLLCALLSENRTCLENIITTFCPRAGWLWCALDPFPPSGFQASPGMRPRAGAESRALWPLRFPGKRGRSWSWSWDTVPHKACWSDQTPRLCQRLGGVRSCC